MKRPETVETFYDRKGLTHEESSLFNIFANDGQCTEPHIYNRRDFYKVSLLEGSSRLSWHHQEIVINRPALVFFTPLTPFAWEPVSAEQPGFFCLFKKVFLHSADRDESLQNSPLFKTGSNPVYFLDNAQLPYIRDIFSKMLATIGSDYLYKYDLLRNYLHLLIHEALKMEPGPGAVKQGNAAERIASLFLELLERQFPIDTPDRSLKLRTAGDYARALSVHVNHLNHAVREVTGQPTSAHISGRVLAEAKALLKHTDWPVATIAHSLGFAYPNYFYNFFKKGTGHPPRRFRGRPL
ncbi:helix-turn-helix domain-containing protein [Chitinophaga japonensis]|uniref:Helix-turn-helix protein n=1 Tax=Chitinophaga japonensis TaxID=104662 RepID=A0A562T048_CHIJA|nr:helix-turn-helix domain-containing protein [Chitinophaga japonensis]TWI86380.1 helix-turn-helix protein [Chitinophaga japonensis]